MRINLDINLNAPPALLAAREYGGSALGGGFKLEVVALPHIVGCSMYAALLLLLFSH